MFERYTDAAKRVVFYARAEALHQKATAISTKHLLVGLTYEGNSRACQIGSLKENASNLRSSVGVPWPTTKLVQSSEPGIPLDKNAKIALTYAAREANRDLQFWIDSDHLLRGLMRFPNDASQTMQKIGLDLGSARAASAENRKRFPAQSALQLRLLKILLRKYWMKILLVVLLALVFGYLKMQS